MTFDALTPRSTNGPSPIDSAAPAQEHVSLEPENVVGTTETPRGAIQQPTVPAGFSRSRAKAAQPKAPARSSAARKRRPSRLVVAPDKRRELLWKEPSLLKKVRFLFQPRYDEQGERIVPADPRYERFKRFARFAVSAYGISLVCHTILLCIIALVAFRLPQTGKSFSLLFSKSHNDIIEFDETINTELETVGGADQKLEVAPLEIVQSTQSEIVRLPLPEDLRPKLPGTGTGGSEGEGDGPKFAMPTSGKVVTKGSFTAWTIPEDPAPGQSYLIVIQIKVPTRIKRYRSTDLTGMVVGTDGYRQSIPGFKRGWLPIKDRQAQLVIPVPGAARLVKDTINIRSRILREKQALQIVF